MDPRQSVYRHRVDNPVERDLIRRYSRPGSRALDVGTAAMGRSALLLHDAGCDVTSIEYSDAAIREFAAGAERRPGIELATADMAALPFAAGSFDLVLIALQGLDYATEPEVRARIHTEAAGVLRDGGHLVFNASNTVGLVLGPSGLRSPSLRRLRVRHVMRRRMFRPTFVDVNGLEPHQARPRRIIREVEAEGDLSFVEASNGSGSSGNLATLTLLAAMPYYVFRRRPRSGGGSIDRDAEGAVSR